MSEEIPDQCDGCRFKTTKLKPWQHPEYRAVPRRVPEKSWFCELCYNTTCANTVIYQGNYSHETAELMKVVCYVGNTILAELRRPPFIVSSLSPEDLGKLRPGPWVEIDGVRTDQMGPVVINTSDYVCKAHQTLLCPICGPAGGG